MLSIKSPVRKNLSKFTKYFLSYIPLSFLYKLIQISILRQEFADLKKTPAFYEREKMWDSLIGKIGENEKVIYIEFGVCKDILSNTLHQKIKIKIVYLLD